MTSNIQSRHSDDKTHGRPRVAVVTGAQQGIGREVAMALGRSGMTIVANYLDDAESARALADELSAIGSSCHLVQGDIAQIAQIEALMSAADRVGGIDVLVNNAAIFPRMAFLDLSEALWDQTMMINLKAPFLCTQLAARRMVDQGRGGAIVNLSSIAAFRGSPNATHYITSKAGLVGLTRATAIELAPHRIRVNAVAPGLTDTAQPRYGMSEEEIAAAGLQVPLGRLAVASDIASVVRFLASDESLHVTGQTWHVNGGQFQY